MIICPIYKSVKITKKLFLKFISTFGDFPVFIKKRNLQKVKVEFHQNLRYVFKKKCFYHMLRQTLSEGTHRNYLLFCKFRILL